jgi:hypothetical protein
MANSTAENRRAIAKLTGKDLPTFVPNSISEETAKLVRECILESGKTQNLTVSRQVFDLLVKGLEKQVKPKYTISQYLLLVLSSINATEALSKKHTAGKISDREFIDLIKGNTNANNRKAKPPRKMGRQKVETDARDRAVDADKVQ